MLSAARRLTSGEVAPAETFTARACAAGLARLAPYRAAVYLYSMLLQTGFGCTLDPRCLSEEWAHTLKLQCTLSIVCTLYRKLGWAR